jgi:aminoglycoside phosphotransferase (APT) family kinase protein
VLRRLQGRLSLPVPNPTLKGQDAVTGELSWMGYALLPGEPLWDEELEVLGEADQRQVALQLAGFLHALHGDFGGGNILYDPATRRVTGVIDFGGVALGDPAVDIAALSCYGEPFLALGAPAYPGIATLLPRARRYRATFALQQALVRRASA